MPPSGSKQYLAFISYSHEDESWAKQLYNDLIAVKGIPKERLFLDEPSITPADVWKQTLRAALNSSCYLLVLWSSKAKDSEWVQHEIVSFENKIDTPDAEMIKVHRRMIFVSLDVDTKIYKEIQMIKTLKKINAYDPKNPTIDKLLKDNQSDWKQVVEKVYHLITTDDSSIAVPLLVMATTSDRVQKLDFSEKPQFGGFTKSLDELLGNAIGIPTKQELIARYGLSRSEWKPIVGDNSTVDELLIRLRDEINRNSKSPTIRWEPVDDEFWDDADEARAIADSLSSGLALIVIDPISLYDPLVHYRFSILREQLCFDNENAVFLVLSPFQMPTPNVSFRELIRDAARSVFNDYYLPGVRRIPYARCSVNFGDDMGMMRPVLATIKNYFYQNQRQQTPVQTSVGNGR